MSTCNNVAMFRTGIREARTAEERLGGWAGGSLTRLRRLECAATISSGGTLTDAFTLTVDHNDRTAGDSVRAAQLEARSRATLAVDLQQVPPLTFRDIDRTMRLARVGSERAATDRSVSDEERPRRARLDEIKRLAQSRAID